MKMNCRLGRPKTVVFFLDRLENYKSTSKPRCTVHIHLGMAKRKLGKSHVTSDYSWETEVPVNLPSDVTDDTVITLRVMDNKREVGSTCVELFHLPYDTPHRTGRLAFPSIPHRLDEPFRRNTKPSNGSLPYALLYSCWIRDVDGETGNRVVEPKSSRTWKPLRRLRKAFSRSNLTKDDSSVDTGGGGLKKKFAKSMYDLTAVPSPAESEALRANGMMLRPINLDEPCPPPRNGFRNATSLHNLAMSDFEFHEPQTTADQLVAWVHEQVPCPPAPVNGEEVLEPSIRDVEPREVIWGEENVLSIYGEGLGNAGRDIERLTVCGIDVTDSCYSDPPSSEIPYDHIMCHIHGDEDGLPTPRPGEPLRRGHVEILYKDGRQVKSMQRVTLLPPTADELTPGPTESSTTDEADTGAPFDLDNFHPSSGVLQATQAMVAAGQLEAEEQLDSQGLHVVVKPRVSSFSGHIDAAATQGVCHTKNSSMPHLGQCSPPDDELEKKEEEVVEEVVKRKKEGPKDGERVTSVKQMKARRGSEKSLRGLSFPRFLSRSRLDLTEGPSCDLGHSGDAGDEEMEEDSMADSAYDTLQKLFRRGPHRRRKCQSRSSSINSADMIEENQKLKMENQNLKEDIEALWVVNRDQKREVNNLRRKLHELTSAFEKHKSESDLHVNELMNLKLRLLADQRDEYLCID